MDGQTTQRDLPDWKLHKLSLVATVLQISTDSFKTTRKQPQKKATKDYQNQPENPVGWVTFRKWSGFWIGEPEESHCLFE